MSTLVVGPSYEAGLELATLADDTRIIVPILVPEAGLAVAVLAYVSQDGVPMRGGVYRAGSVLVQSVVRGSEVAPRVTRLPFVTPAALVVGETVNVCWHADANLGRYRRQGLPNGSGLVRTGDTFADGMDAAEGAPTAQTHQTVIQLEIERVALRRRGWPDR